MLVEFYCICCHVLIAKVILSSSWQFLVSAVQLTGFYFFMISLSQRLLNICLLTHFITIHSSDLQAHLNASMDVPCNFTLETYACAQVTAAFRVKLEIRGSITENWLSTTCCMFDWINKCLSHMCSWKTSQPTSWWLFWSVICLETAATPKYCGRCCWPSFPLSWTQHWTSWLTWYTAF